MQACVCTKCSIPSHQVCICSSLHWKEFKIFSGCCPLAVKASTWNRNKICNGFRKTWFSQSPKNGNSFSSSPWRWGGLGILWKKGAFEEPAGSSHCSLLMPELISWSLRRAKDSFGSQHVKCLRLSSKKTKTCKKCCSKDLAMVTQERFLLLGHLSAHPWLSRRQWHYSLAKAVPRSQICPLPADSFSSAEMILHTPSLCSALEQTFPEDLSLQCWSLLSLGILWAPKPWEMLDLPLHTTASLNRKTAHCSSG